MHVSPPGPDRSLGVVPEPLLRRPRLALTLLCLLLWLPGFFTLPPTDRDEARFAQASRQMLESGDPVRIRFQAEERNKKPAGIHWLQAGAVAALEAVGVADRAQIWPYRVPSLLGALLAVLATYQFGGALVGRRQALLGAGMLASCLVLMAEAHIAKTDAALLATVTAAMGLFGAAYLRPEAFRPWQAAAFWAVLGASVLLKGPIGPMVPLLTGVTLAVADRGAPWLRALRPFWGVPVMLAVCVPWLVAIGIATDGRFFADAVGGDMLAKVGGAEEKHWGPPGFYVLTFGIAAFPVAWIVLLGLPDAWAARAVPQIRFLLAWIVPSWLLFEAVATKLPHYTLPLFPPLMLLGAAWAMDPLRPIPGRLWQRISVFALTGTLMGLSLAASVFGALWTEGIAWGMLLVPLAALGLLRAVQKALGAGEPGGAALACVLCAIPVYAGAMGGLLPYVERAWIAPRLSEAVARAAPGVPPAAIGVVGIAEPSVVFALGTGIALLPDGAAAARFLAAAPGRVAIVEDRADPAFQAAAAATPLAIRAAPDPVSGFNYSRGRRVRLTVWQAAPS